MAIVWEKTAGDGAHYEVRRAGQSLRLYTNGVLHTQYHRGEHLTGSVWDLLMLPALYYPPQHIRHVLVLGVGGGAVIRQLQHFIAPSTITGVDLNPVHLQIARRFFGCNERHGVTLVREDAVTWLARNRRRFDLIIDDLFAEVNGDPVRAIPVDAAWTAQLTRALSSRGILVINQVHARDTRAMPLVQGTAKQHGFVAAQVFNTPYYDNSVSAWYREKPETQHMQTRSALFPALRRGGKGRLRFRMRNMPL